MFDPKATDISVSYRAVYFFAAARDAIPLRMRDALTALCGALGRRLAFRVQHG
jgi:hypothetical protein